MSDNLYQAPAETSAPTTGTLTQPTLKQKLFSFQGRFSRSQYWGWSVGISTLVSFLAAIPYLILVFHLISADQNGPNNINIPLVVGLAFLTLVLYLPALWISLAGIAKRFHDRNKSGWMAAVAFIPYVGAFWILIECGCLQGTVGPNLFGEDPVGK